jgi:hypothetical protein
MGKSNDIKNSKSTLTQIFSYLHNNIQSINNSKMFAGLMIITLNIASKFVNIKLSKTMEAYLKFTFSKQILVFAIAWMGTRDIYIAFAIACIFVILTEYLLHEDSAFSVLPEEFKDRHLELLENETNNDEVSEDEIKKAKAVLAKAADQNKMAEFQSYSMK